MKMQEQDYRPFVNNVPHSERGISGGFGKRPADWLKKTLCAGVFLLAVGINPEMRLGIVSSAAAQATQEGGDFTFRRVAPPQAGGKRITVQIDPNVETFRITTTGETSWTTTEK